MQVNQEYTAAVLQQDWERAAALLRFLAEQRNIAAVEEMIPPDELEEEDWL